jgi:hypothetical protein
MGDTSGMKRRCLPKKAAPAALTRAVQSVRRRKRKFSLSGHQQAEAVSAAPKSPWNPKFDHFTKLI